MMMFRSTCHNELEEMSRDGSRRLLTAKSGVETELLAGLRGAERELGVTGPMSTCDRDHTYHAFGELHSMDIIIVFG
jgi:hypothetical protein